jgi:hypothetical protein
MSRIPNLASERGAVFVQTAIAAVVLLGFGTFVVDYGVLWVARHQAQNAADAGALAGALARAYDDFFDNVGDSNGATDLNATVVAATNLVFGVPATPVVPPLDLSCPPEVGASGHCVTVEVYRNGEFLSARLPTWFGPVLGITSQGVKATATARVVIPNATDCLRPWAIPDQWTEGHAGPDFQKYGPGGTPLGTQDVYDPPSPSGPGTGLRFATSNTVPNDFGLSVSRTPYTDFRTDLIERGWVVPLEPPSSTYADSLAGCNGRQVTVGDQIPIRDSGALLSSDFDGLYSQDPSASWNAISRTIDASCAPRSCAPPRPFSPRLVAIAVFDVDVFQRRRAMDDWSACDPPGVPCVSVVNIVGFFIDDAAGSGGHLTSYPGLVPLPAEFPKLTAESSFLKAITLVR